MNYSQGFPFFYVHEQFLKFHLYLNRNSNPSNNRRNLNPIHTSKTFKISKDHMDL